MRRIVNGLLYDTEKAELIYTDSTKHRMYYRTENGRYFVAYRTGEIGVKSEDSIKKLLGANDIDKYTELFGEPKEA